MTENIVQTNEGNLTIFNELKKLGVLIAIDDFGTGYSSFASLKHLNVNSLKIDKHFINDIITDSKVKILIHSMIELGSNMQYKIIVEGIETKEELAIVQELGCDIIQGYFFSKPLDNHEVTNYLRTVS